MLLKEVCYAQQDCYLFDQKYSDILQFIISFLFEYVVKCNLFLWRKAEFSASLLQSHDLSEIIQICKCAAQETFIVINVENSCAAAYFCGSDIFQDSLMMMIESSKEQRLFETEIFITNYVFTVTFDRFNASLLNKKNQ